MPDTDATLREFTQYYEAHKKAILTYLLYRVNFDRDVAEDLTSEVFIKAFEHFDQYDRNRPFKTWVFTIAHNHLINYLESRKQTLPLDEAIETPTKDKTIVEEVAHTMTMERVTRHLKKLPEEKRELIVMRYVNDLSNSEIAAITGKEEGAIRTALSRALTTLREALNSSN